MKLSALALVFIAFSSVGFSQEPRKDSPKGKDEELGLEIKSHNATSWTEESGKTISEFNALSITLFRMDKTGKKAQGMIFKADHGTLESLPDGILEKFALKGNVRAEETDGTVILANEAVIDLVEQTYTVKRRIKIVGSEK